MAVQSLHVGDTVTIEQRPAGERSNKILRAYERPRGQTAIRVDEVTPDHVKLTAVEPGYALVDVIDEVSEPAGTDYEFIVADEFERTAPAEPAPIAVTPAPAA